MSKAKIVEALRALAVPIDSVVLDAGNPRLHSERNIESIKASLERFGQRRPIVVQEAGRVVRVGNGRVIAARELGWDEIAAIVVPDDAVEAAAYALSDNRTADLAEWDYSALGDVLTALCGDLAGTGFSEDDVAFLRDGPDDPRAEWTGMPEYEHEDQEAWRSVRVKFPNAEAYRQFQEIIGQTLTDKTRSIWYPKAAWEYTTDRAYDPEERA